MTFRELELFLVVADERSFVKAARKLFISQPAVTQQIKKMENELGFSLLYRDRHTVELTAQGEIMQNAARSILYTYNHAIADALRNSTSEQSLSIGYLGQMNLTLLPEIMKSFQLRYPNFSVLASRVRPTQISALLEQGLLQMIMTPYDFVANNRALSFYPLYHDRHYCIMNKGNPLAEQEQLSCQDLSGYSILVPAKENCPDHMRTAIGMLESISIGCHFELGNDSDNVAFQLMATEAKVAIMPSYTIPNHPDLVSVPLDDDVQILTGIAYYQEMTPLEKAFSSTAYQVLNTNRKI